jgi:hypothetical protein
MKVTLELPENEVHEIINFTGIPKKGPAIRRWVSDALALRRRSEMTNHYLRGKWSAELSGYESSRQADRDNTLTLDKQWRD